jgi:hypothetical protein
MVKKYLLLLAMFRCFCTLFLAVIMPASSQNVKIFRGEGRLPGCFFAAFTAVTANAVGVKVEELAKNEERLSTGHRCYPSFPRKRESRVARPERLPLDPRFRGGDDNRL